MTVYCSVCEEEFSSCPECGKEFLHGAASNCDEEQCEQVNTPLDCHGCGFVVSSGLDGVLNFDMELVPYSIEGGK